MEPTVGERFTQSSFVPGGTDRGSANPLIGTGFGEPIDVFRRDRLDGQILPLSQRLAIEVGGDELRRRAALLGGDLGVGAVLLAGADILNPFFHAVAADDHDPLFRQAKCYTRALAP